MRIVRRLSELFECQIILEFVKSIPWMIHDKNDIICKSARVTIYNSMSNAIKVVYKEKISHQSHKVMCIRHKAGS